MIAENGFSFQLNAYGKKNDPYLSRQYSFLVDPNINNPAELQYWASMGGGNLKEVKKVGPLAQLQDQVLPAGSKLTITLGTGTGPAGGATATFGFVPAGGAGVSITPDLGNVTMPAAVAFQLNLVGPYNGEFTQFRSGAGTFTYQGPSALSVASAWPPCVQLDWFTVEDSNSLYGSLRNEPSKWILQAFGQAMAPARLSANVPPAASP